LDTLGSNCAWRKRLCRRDFDAFEELDESHLKPPGEDEQSPKRGVLKASFEVTDIRAAQAAVLRQIILVPAPRLTQATDALPEPKIDISICHPYSMDVFYWLYFAKWLHFV
jgi:hypothetical protein